MGVIWMTVLVCITFIHTVQGFGDITEQPKSDDDRFGDITEQPKSDDDRFGDITEQPKSDDDREKPGKCPENTNTDHTVTCWPELILYYCYSDGNCPGEQKCCIHECSNVCQDPVLLR